ncbi:hypothetical protein ABT072_35985 [Streptomyces sp. NPDC002589]
MTGVVLVVASTHLRACDVPEARQGMVRCRPLPRRDKLQVGLCLELEP